MKKTRVKAYFMLALILCLPVYVSSAYAIEPDRFPGELKEIRVYGNENQTMALRTNSRVYVDAVVAKPDVQPSRLVFSDGQTFNTCLPHPEGSICSLIITPPTALVQGVKDYSIIYYPESGTPYSLSGAYVVDSTPPQVSMFRVTPSIVGKEDLTISYTAIDYSNNAQFCAGVAGFEIASDPMFQNLVANVQVNVTSLRDCMKTGTIKVASPTQSGHYTWYARAYDRLGNFAYSFVQTTFEVDADAPEILQPMLYKEGNQINYTDVGTQNYEIRAEIREAHGLKSAELDIASDQGRCASLGGESYECIWQITATTSASTRSISGTITAKDNLNNSVRRQFSVGISIDADAPLIGFFGSEYGNYIGAGANTLKVHAIEQQSGYGTTTVFADLHLINSAYGTEKHPDKCEQEYCYWYNITTPKPSGIYGARVYVSDFLGHKSFMDTDFVIDKQLPVIKSIEQSNLFPTGDDPLFFTLNVSDNTGIATATANISAISTHPGLIQGNCEEYRTGNFSCIFEAVGLKTYASTGKIVFNVTDLAGNSAAQQYNITLYEAEYTTVPNELSVSVGEIIPSRLQKEIALNLPVKVYLGLNMQYKHSNVQIVLKGQPNCPGLVQLNLLPNYGTDNPYWIGNNYIVFETKLDNATSALQNIEINCTVDFIVRRGGKLFYNPEQEHIFANLSVYSGSTIDSTFISKLQDMHDSVEEDFDWVTDLNDFFVSLEDICDAFEVFKDAYNFLQALKPALYGILWLVHKYPPTAAVADNTWKYYNQAVCYLAVAKNYAWPNDDPANPKNIFGEWKDTRGWVRNICAFVKCRQCNTEWSSIYNLTSGPSNWLEGKLKGGIFEGVDFTTSVDPFRNWAVSIGCFCIPGMIRNAERYRQMECMHARCLIENAKLGQSTAFCDEEDKVRKCVFWWGALLKLVPSYMLIQLIVKKIQNAIVNIPARLLIAARGSLCRVFDERIGTSSKEMTMAGKAQDASDCTTDKMPTGIPDVGNAKLMLCSLLDTAMLVWAWDDMIETAFNPEKYSWNKEEVDYCKQIDWAAAGVE